MRILTTMQKRGIFFVWFVTFNIEILNDGVRNAKMNSWGF